METLIERIAEYGVLAAILAYFLFVGHTKILPLWKETVEVLSKAMGVISEQMEYMRGKNGKDT